MSWLVIIFISYFILSISNLVDKIFLSKIVTESIVYAIWVSILSVGIVGIFVIHWILDNSAYSHLKSLGELSMMTPWFILVSIIVGILFTTSIYLLYTSLQKGEASRVIPLIGGSMPVIIYLLTVWYDPLDAGKFMAFFFLVLGTVLISIMPARHGTTKRRVSVGLALAASLSFAIFFVLMQYIFRQQGFINGIVWPRLGSFFALLYLFAFPNIRKMMRYSLSHLSLKLRAGWLFNQSLGAIGFLGQQYVISIPGVSVALVSALQSIQYAFILIFATGLSLFQPKILQEVITPKVIIQKVLAFVAIGIGLFLII